MTAGVASAGASVTATASRRVRRARLAVDYINYVAPRAEKASVKDVKLTKDARLNKGGRRRDRAGHAGRRQVRGGQPGRGRQLARLEAKAIRREDPRQITSTRTPRPPRPPSC